jgi:hypothetical protein
MTVARRTLVLCPVRGISLSAHWGERAGVRWERSECAHLTLPLRGPLPLPPMGGEGK